MDDELRQDILDYFPTLLDHSLVKKEVTQA